MIIECPYCKAKVEAKEIATHESFDPYADPAPFRAILLECPVCENSILAGQDLIDIGPDKAEWSPASRLWPSPKRYLPWTIPHLIRSSLEEADRCLRANAYIASVAMSGRALEGICRHFKTESPYLGGGLKELLKRGVIDTRLFQWSQELREHRNIAAHATDEKISEEDAEDLLDFVTAICDYVFVLSEKFERFMQRKEKSAT
jgi:hypothetical protein